MKSSILNPVIWNVNGELYTPIRNRLLLIAKKFLKTIEIPFELKNIFLTGSLCSYEWSDTSDWDLHIIVSTEEGCCSDTTAADYFDVKSKLYNKEHNIIIKGYPVELNIKDKEDLLKGKAVFDLISYKWIRKPKKGNRFLDDKEVLEVAKKFENIIDDAVDNKKSLEDLKEIRNKIKELRSHGLKTEGEFSIGNLAFKNLRHSGYIKKLYDYKAKVVDKSLSMESFSCFLKNNCV